MRRTRAPHRWLTPATEAKTSWADFRSLFNLSSRDDVPLTLRQRSVSTMTPKRQKTRGTRSGEMAALEVEGGCLLEAIKYRDCRRELGQSARRAAVPGARRHGRPAGARLLRRRIASSRPSGRQLFEQRLDLRLNAASKNDDVVRRAGCEALPPKRPEFDADTVATRRCSRRALAQVGLE